MRKPALAAAWVLGFVVTLAGCVTGGGGPVSKQYSPAALLTQWDDSDWRTVLETVCTSDGFVRYDALTNNTHGARDALFRYVGRVDQTSPQNRPELFPDDGDKLAYYVNAYNALCMYAVYQRGAAANLSGAERYRYAMFYKDKFRVGGVDMTLEAIERQKIRVHGDPRTHFALNGMSRSAPPLLGEPYEGGRLDAQLDAQGRRYLDDPRGVQRVSDAKVKLSEVFTKFYVQEWKDAYARQTGRKDPGLLEAIRPYAGPNSPVQTATEYESMDFDWSVNRAR